MSNRGAILSNSFVNAASIEAGDAPFAELVDDDVEYLHCLTRAGRSLQPVKLRRAVEHLKTLLAIITSTPNWCL
jgi:hypothetical protein